MVFLLILVLFAPLALYLTVAFGILNLAIGFFSFLGAIGAFLVGVAAYQQVQARLWQYEQPRFIGAWYLAGVAVIGVAARGLVREIPIDEAIFLRVLLRFACLAFWVICYILSLRMCLEKRRKWEWIIFGCVAVVLVLLTVLSVWFVAVNDICFYMILAVSVFTLVRNARLVIHYNLQRFHQPFVLYRPADSHGKATSLFADVLFIAFPVLVVLIW
ncbi:MAG: hypothetical protein J6D21_12425 [Clostridia bacterium]|nr:hypothetical protein [Clostridia bacterium]